MIRAVFFTVVIFILAACGKTGDGKPPEFGESVAVLSGKVWRGVCFAHSWENGGALGYGSGAGFEALSHLRNQGVDYISVTPFGFMESPGSPEILGTHNSQFNFSETDRRVADVTTQAKRLGMRVMLKPHIWIRRGHWRGEIVPKDGAGNIVWERWWDNHNEWIMHYARLAEELGADSLVIGVELSSAVKSRPDKLIELVGAVRSVYNGRITYSANWDEPVPLNIWKMLDFVGVQFYPPLVGEGEEQTDSVIRVNLNRHLNHWVGIANRAQKPLVATEYGFRSAEGAARYPYKWPDRNPDETPDNALQARLYGIFLEEFSKRDEVRGLFLWKYFTNKDTDEEGPTGFSPRGKSAEGVIREFYGGAGADGG